MGTCLLVGRIGGWESTYRYSHHRQRWARPYDLTHPCPPTRLCHPKNLPRTVGGHPHSGTFSDTALPGSQAGSHRPTAYEAVDARKRDGGHP